MPVVFKIKAAKVGNSVRMTIPQEICEALSVAPGDTLLVSLTDHTIEVKKW